MIVNVRRSAEEGDVMGFEVFVKTSAPVSKVPTATLQKRGLISLSRAAHRLIDEAEFAELLWDADRRVIGLRPTTSENPNAYPIRPQTSNSERGPMLVAAGVFTRHYDIDTEESRRWVVRTEDGVLCIDLSQDGQRVTSNRNGRNAGSAAAGG